MTQSVHRFKAKEIPDSDFRYQDLMAMHPKVIIWAIKYDREFDPTYNNNEAILSASKRAYRSLETSFRRSSRGISEIEPMTGVHPGMAYTQRRYPSRLYYEANSIGVLSGRRRRTTSHPYKSSRRHMRKTLRSLHTYFFDKSVLFF
jgi:hypothetical protein